jgi:hypothetical protein
MRRVKLTAKQRRVKPSASSPDAAERIEVSLSDHHALAAKPPTVSSWS